MGTNPADDRVARRDPIHPADDRPADPIVDRVALSPGIPTLEWVFMSNTVLGGVAPGCRSVTLNGVTRTYAPWANVDHGARWCSPAWLDRQLGTRGFLARKQGVHSKMGLCVAGGVREGTVLVLPEEQLDTAAALAAGMLTNNWDALSGVSEWSTAIVREPGRSRLALRILPIGRAYKATLRSFAAELNVECFLQIKPGHDRDRVDGRTVSTPDLCTVQSADVILGELEGLIHLEDEPIPARLVDIAERFGDGLSLTGKRSAGIHVPNGSCRPLEPDESRQPTMTPAVGSHHLR
ncbi:MAG: hypothetical protein ABI647_20590 [Gemmatimonadota bacterium]